MFMIMKKLVTEENIPEIAEYLIRVCNEKKLSDKAVLVFLSGDLGAGKTTATKTIAKMFGVQEDVTSPTFVILKRYEIPESSEVVFKNLIHIDAYRLQSYEELKKISFEKYLQDGGNIILLEWPEMVADGGLVADVVVKIEHGEKEGERVVEVF